MKPALPSNIVIAGGPAFQNKVLRDLFFLSRTEQGRKVLDRLAASGKTVTIRDAKDLPRDGDPKNSKTRAIGDGHADVAASDVVIYYDTDPANRTVWSEEAYVTTVTSPQVNLFHEMVHGMQMAEGDALPPDRLIPGYPPDEPYAEEEARTIGDSSEGWGDEDPSENALRDELGMPRRRDINTPETPQEGHISGPTDHRPGADP